MATIDKVVIEIVGDTKDIESTVKQLEKVGKVDRENAASFKKTSSEFEVAAKKRAFLLDRAIKRLGKLQTERKKAFNPKDIRRFDERINKTSKDIEILGGKLQKVNKSSGLLGTTLGKLGAIIVGAFAVRSIINFSEHLFEVAIESEAFGKRARKVFGESLGIVEEFAKGSAKSLGFTELGFLGAAAAVGDILVPLGLSRERAAEMSAEAVKLGGALKEFTGDSRSAAQISNIVAKSLTGEVETLKTLGVVIDQTSKEFKDLVKSKQVDLGLTRQQAKAETIFQLAIDGSKDALEAFETNADSLARQQSILTATFTEQTEHLAEFLTPAFIAVLKQINSFTKSANDLGQELIKQNAAFVKQEKEITVLVSRYDELTSQTDLNSDQTDLNSDEQTELRDIIEDLADRVPEAVTEFDRYGTALDINTEKVIANLEQQQNILKLRNVEVIKDIREEIRRFTAEVTRNTEILNRGAKIVDKLGGKTAITTREVKLGADEFRNMSNESVVFNANIADLLLTLAELGIELTDVEKEFIDTALGIDKFRKAVEDDDPIIKEQIKNIFFLKNAISELRKEQQKQTTSLGRVAEINKKLIPLQKELNGLLGKGATTAYEKLTKEVSDLNKELLNQAVIGKIDQNTIDKLEVATRKLVVAEVALLIATTDTLEPMKAAKLELLDIEKDSFKERKKLLDDWKKQLELAAEEEKRINEDKRDTTIAIAVQIFSLLAVLQDRKLAKLEKESKKELEILQEKRDKDLISEEAFEEQKQAILKKTDDKRREILTKQAKLQKTAAIIEATINTAVAVTKVIEQPILAALVAILGAAEIATIAAQPIPEFHTGKKSELKDGELYAKILKSESVIPPEQSKKYKGAIDSMIDKKFESYIFHEYMLPMIKGMGKKEISEPYNDIMLWNNQKKQILLTRETNKLLKGLQLSGNPWRSWR